MILTLAAALVQQQPIALHPVYFNHNALLSRDPGDRDRG